METKTSLVDGVWVPNTFLLVETNRAGTCFDDVIDTVSSTDEQLVVRLVVWQN